MSQVEQSKTKQTVQGLNLLDFIMGQVDGLHIDSFGDKGTDLSDGVVRVLEGDYLGWLVEAGDFVEGLLPGLFGWRGIVFKHVINCLISNDSPILL